MSWTKQDIERVRAMVAEGVSNSEIAAALGGRTRNQVMGVIARNKLRTASDIIPPAIRANSRKAAEAAGREPSEAGSLPPMPIRHEEGDGPTLETIGANLCRFPVGARTGADQMFCGRPVLRDADGSPSCSYCETHGTPGITGSAFYGPRKSSADLERMVVAVSRTQGRRSPR